MELHEFHAQEEPSSTVQQPYTPKDTDMSSATPLSMGGTQAFSYSIWSMAMPSSLSVPVLGTLSLAVLFILGFISGYICVFNLIKLTVVFTLARKRKSSTKGSAIVLIGPSDAGKTAIYSAVSHDCSQSDWF